MERLSRADREITAQKQMRLGPATQAALLSRMLPTAVFRQGRKIIAARAPKSARQRPN
jgi:hypothetical protein